MNVPFRVGSTTALSNEHLPSPAQFVLVDNTSNQWLYQPDAQRYIAPYAMNITMPLTGASGANMQVASPPGVTQAAPIAGQQYLAVFSDSNPGGLPYTSQTTVEITDGKVDATITGGTVDATITGTVDANVTGSVNANVTGGTINANVTGGTIDANITNATIDASITNSTIDINNVTPDVGLLTYATNNSLTGGVATDLETIGSNVLIRGFSVSGSVGGLVAIYAGTSGGAIQVFWQGIIAGNTPVTFIYPAGSGIHNGTNTHIWLFVQTGGEYAITIYTS